VASVPEIPAGFGRLELHSGLSRGTKIFLGVFLVGLLVVAAPSLGLIAGALTYTLASHAAGVIVGIAVTLVTDLVLVITLLTVLRAAAWLDQTTLVVRGAFTTRRCDLATGRGLHLDAVAETANTPAPGGMLVMSTGRQLPRLTASDAITGQRVRLVLRDPATRKLLAPQKLYALAEAILTGRGQEPGAWQVADGLRAMADPRTSIR